MSPRLTTLASALAMVAASGNVAASVFINELHYDNVGTDSEEFVEITGPTGTDLSGWSLVLYNGSNSSRAPYNTLPLSGMLADDTGSGFGFHVVRFPSNGLQNGSPDGLALVNAGGSVVQFLSYEGSFTAASGPATDMTSSDIGVAESSSTAVGQSLQLQGSGADAGDFSWGAAAATRGAANNDQRLGGSGEPPAPPPPVSLVPIYQLQGADHMSPFAGVTVTTRGIVTAVARKGFYLQDPVGDGDIVTSDGIYIYTGDAPTVAVGDDVQIKGTVSEFVPGGQNSNNLSITEIYRPQVEVLSGGNPLPAAIVIGQAGRQLPSVTIEDDQFTSFDPNQDGLDFFESLEAMRVTVSDAAAVSPTNRFGETFVVADLGIDASGMNARGGITIAADDFNPERIQIDPDDSLLPGITLQLDTGDRVGDVTGVIGYSYGNYELYPTEMPVTTPGRLSPEQGPAETSSRALRVASYNLLNLDPNDADGDSDIADGRFNAIADQIVNALASPAVVAVQEIQDNSGSVDDGTVDADITFKTLTAAIREAGGPGYAFIDNPPSDGADGGQPGGNIRVGFLYDPSRVKLIDGSVQRLTDSDLTDGDAFAASRKPLAAAFRQGSEVVHVINNHFSSKGGSTPLYGAVQPPVNGNEDARVAQALEVRRYVESLQTADPDINVVVLGDLNEFQFMPPLKTLAGTETPVLVNLTDTLPATARYTYNYQGNAQALDHVLVSYTLANRASYDIVHVNSEFASQASDHDPVVATLQLGKPHNNLRVATFNASLNRTAPGELISDLATGTNTQARNVAAIIQRVRPDVILLNEFDYDAKGRAAELFLTRYLNVGQHGERPINYPHLFSAPVNTGVPSGMDLDRDGRTNGPGDAYGFGFYPGQYGMLVLSRYPIDERHARTFQHFLWKDMPNALLPDDPSTGAPADWYSTNQLAKLRLSSKSHWDLPIRMRGRVIHLLASHPTPPVFDGPEDRNGTRNHDEIRFWADYVVPENSAYIYDDRGHRGGLSKDARFVIVGDMNAAPLDGDSTAQAINQLLLNPRINTTITPASEGAADATLRQAGVNTVHQDNPAFDTADFADTAPGNLRVDYVLPSRSLTLKGAGVFWPTERDPRFSWVGVYPFPSSDHRMVWIDIANPGTSKH